MMLSRSIYIAANGIILFFFLLAEKYSSEYTHHILFLIRLFMDTWFASVSWLLLTELQ